MSADAAKGSEPSFDVLVERDVRVPMRDGIPLAADIAFPAHGGRRIEEALPAVLTRTPYNKTGLAETARFFASRGYVFVAQDVRGRYASEGLFYPFAHEGPDGYDTVEWIAAQPWCNGKVGTTGASYCAAVQDALACLNPPHLAAMVPIFGPSSFFHSSMRHNGALEMRFFNYAFSMAVTSREAAADPLIKAALEETRKRPMDWLKAYPIRKGETPLRFIPSIEQWAVDIATSARYDDSWRLPGYGPRPYYAQRADVPALYIGGWYDSYTRGTLENFTALHERFGERVQVLMGPWIHDVKAEAKAGDMSSAPEGGLPGLLDVQQRWFDQWLKGLPVGVDREPPVRYFVMGGGSGDDASARTIHHGGVWKTASSWPPPGAHSTPFYFHGDGSLRTCPSDAEEASTSYTFDPRNPVPTIGGNHSALGAVPGGFDQRGDVRFPGSTEGMPLSARQDVLCFTTALLEEDVEIAGPIEARLWVSTDGPDTDFTVKLIDVFPPSAAYPDGAALNITDSIQRLRFRNGYECEEPAIPGEVYALRFDLYPTANRFMRGHRIRIDVSSSNFPRFDVNPNTGGPLGAERRFRIAANALHHDRSRPSQVALTVVPSAR